MHNSNCCKLTNFHGLKFRCTSSNHESVKFPCHKNFHVYGTRGVESIVYSVQYSQPNQHSKLDREILTTQEQSASKCEVAFERYQTYVLCCGLCSMCVKCLCYSRNNFCALFHVCSLSLMKITGSAGRYTGILIYRGIIIKPVITIL